MEHTQEKLQKKEIQTFTQRLDFYWQFFGVYAVALIVYSALKGSLVNYTFSIVLKDPVVILLAFFIFITVISFALNFYKKRSIIVGINYIIFKSRLGEKKYFFDDILRIAVGKEKVMRIKKRYPVIKISLKNRRRIIRIRPSSFWNDKELVHAFTHLKKQFSR